MEHAASSLGSGPEISVVVPVYNAAATLSACLESLVGQDLDSSLFEILVIDNNSSDGSAEFATRYPRILWRQQPRQGAYAARNLGCRLASGSLLAFLDPDCVPDPGWLSEIRSSFANEDAVQVLLGKRDFAATSRGLSVLSMYDTVLARHVFSQRRAELYFGYTNNMAIRRSCFERFGPFLELPRGADTVLVRGIVDELGPESVSFREEMRVRHLEIGTVLTFFRKRRIYGESNERNRALGSAIPIGSARRWQVYRETVVNNRLGLFAAAHLFVLLGIGVFYYEQGRRRGRRRQS